MRPDDAEVTPLSLSAEEKALPIPVTAGQRNRQALVFLVLALLAAGTAVAWLLQPESFRKLLEVAYQKQVTMQYQQYWLSKFPYLLLVTAFSFALMSFAMWLSGRLLPKYPDRPLPALSPFVRALMLGGLFFIGFWFSYRYWVFFGRALWDYYWKFGEVFHYTIRHHDAQMWGVLQKAMREYAHSPTPMTPLLIGLLMFIFRNSVFWLQALNLAATAGSLFLLRDIMRHMRLNVPFWLIGFLFLTNCTTMHNSFYFTLDAISSFFIVMFFWLWLRWREQRNRLRAACLAVWLTACLFQKLALLPLLSIPVLIEIYDYWRNRRVQLVAFVRVGLWSVALPLLIYGAYLLAFDLTNRLGSQVNILGTGWYEVDHSLRKFLFAAGFSLGPYLPFLFRNNRLREPAHLALAIYMVLFFVGMLATRAPFWTRYFSHLVAPCLLLCAPRLARISVSGSWGVVLPFYLLAVVLVQYTMMYLYVF